jgi:hypothetical protein
VEVPVSDVLFVGLSTGFFVLLSLLVRGMGKL